MEKLLDPLDFFIGFSLSSQPYSREKPVFSSEVYYPKVQIIVTVEMSQRTGINSIQSAIAGNG